MVTSSASGTGQATISYAVIADTSTGRYGSINIGNAVFGVTQTTDDTGFVQQTYLDVLQRPADSTGMNNYVSALGSGAMTRSQVAAALITSPESQNNGLWLVKAYEGLLGRQADYGGWTYWYSVLHAGVPQDSVIAGFMASQEFINRWGTPDNATFVTEAYQFVLGRAPDSSGYNFWLNGLNNGNPRQDMLLGFLNSIEYGVDAQALIEGNLLYLGLLHRLPDSSGLAFWAGILEQGGSLAVIVDGFLSSQEYAERY